MRNKIFGGLVALALALAPAAGANAQPYQPENDEELHGTLSSLVGAPGDTITYTALAHTYLPDEALVEKIRGVEAHAMTLVSTTVKTAPATEGTFTKAASADGSLSFSFTIPLSAQDGDQYEIDVILADGTPWDQFVVTTVVRGVTDPSTGAGTGAGSGSNAAAGSGSGSGGGLAMTGSDIAITGIATGAVLLVVGGIVLVIVRRRRTRADVAA